MKGNATKFCVNLYERTLKTGKIQLYLKISVGGKRIEESTGILIDPDDKKKVVKEKREAAEEYRLKREKELSDIASGTNPSNANNTLFFEYYDKFSDSRPSEGTRRSYRATRRHIEKYEPRQNITFRFITREWLLGFKEFLYSEDTLIKKSSTRGHDPKIHGNKLNINTASCMLKRVVSCINHAFQEGIIQRNPAAGIKNIAMKETSRCFLTEDELLALSQTKCKSEVTKNAFMFSCLTGLRYSDIKALSWSMVEESGGRRIAAVRMQKTDDVVYIDISDTALSFMGEKRDGLVFAGLKTNKQVNNIIDDWRKDAGINKFVTFHIARHTFATLLLKKGANLYVVSKLLGHKSITTTQIYAKIIDKDKQNAVDSLNEIFK